MNFKLIFGIVLFLYIIYKYIYQKGYIIYTMHWYLRKYDDLFNKLRSAPNFIEFQEISEKIVKIKNVLNKKYSNKDLTDGVLLRKKLSQKLNSQFYQNKIRLMKY